VIPTQETISCVWHRSAVTGSSFPRRRDPMYYPNGWTLLFMGVFGGYVRCFSCRLSV